MSVVRLSTNWCVVVSRLGYIRVFVLGGSLSTVNFEDAPQDRGAEYVVALAAPSDPSLGDQTARISEESCQ